MRMEAIVTSEVICIVADLYRERIGHSREAADRLVSSPDLAGGSGPGRVAPGLNASFVATQLFANRTFGSTEPTF